MAQDPWADFEVVQPAQQPAPQNPDPIIRTAPDDSKQQRSVFEDERDFGTDRQDKLFEQTSKLRGEFNSLDFVKEYPTVARQYAFGLQTQPNPSGDQALIVAYAKMLDPASVVREAEFDTTAAADSAVGRTVARIKRELGLEGGGRLSPEARDKVRREMQTLVKQYDTQYQEARQRFAGLAESYQFDPNLIVGQDYSQTFADVIDSYWADTDPTRGQERETEATYAMGYFDENGEPLPDDYMGGVYDEGGEYQGLAGNVSFEGETFAQRQAREAAEARRAQEVASVGEAGAAINDAGAVGKQGLTLGLSDEAAGIGGALSGIFNGDGVVGGYTRARDEEQARIDIARENLGVAGTAIEVAGGGAGILARPGQIMAAGRSVAAGGQPITRGAVQQQLRRQATRDGAAIGALGGFGYGEGAEGSAINALGGAALGGALGNVGQRAGNALANRASRSGYDPARASEVARAGQAEGVTVNRAMIDPRQQNRFSAVETTGQGGPRINRQMDEIEGQIEGRIRQVGGDRQPMDEVAQGDTIQRAGERTIAATREVTNRKYQAAERMAGNVRITPARARSATQTMIRDLSETANTNSAEIAFLKGLSEDFQKPLSIGALRDLRTSLRKKISKGDLVFGQNEARVLQIMDEAAKDISTGLTQAGKPQAAAAFDAADTAYAARMDLIENTVQQLVGKRGANWSAERIAGKMDSMARNDAEGLRRFWSQMEPGEQASMRATFAEALGRDAKGNFAPHIFLNNISGSNRKMSDRAMRIVFGKDGAQSIKNLKTLSEEVNRLNGLRNRSNTGRGNDYRNWLFEAAGFLGGGGTAFMSGGGGVGTAATAIATGAAAAGARAGRDILNARMLMNPRIQKWLLQAPRTQNPKAIDAHFNRLGDIAKAEPAIAGDIELLRKSIIGAANDNAAAGLAAEDQDSGEVK